MMSEMLGKKSKSLLLKNIDNDSTLPVCDVDVVVVFKPLFSTFAIETRVGMKFVNTERFRNYRQIISLGGDNIESFACG